jgi:hypothetical protein
MRRDAIKGPVAPASAIRADQSSQDHQNSTNCGASEGVSSRPRGSTKACRRARCIDFAEVDRAALTVFPAVLQRLLPGGRIIGNEFVALNPRRADRHAGSFKVNTTSGRWSDFATGDKGGDPVSLVAYLANVSQGKAARLLAQMLGIQIGDPE